MLCALSAYSIGESAVITLVFPSGARSLGMGEVGTALADQEDALFYNAAGLGVANSRWQGGAITGFYENPLPAFDIYELYHTHIAGYYQFPGTYTHGIALDFNKVNFGRAEAINGTDTFEISNSYEYVLSAAYGFNLERFGRKNHSFGITAKYIYSPLAPGYDSNGIAQGFAADVGYLWQCMPNVRFGVTLQNMGPNVSYLKHGGWDPLPFTINMALAYTGTVWAKDSVPLCKINAEVRADREIVHTDSVKSPQPFWQALSTSWPNDSLHYWPDEINWHAGVEAVWLNTVCYRAGILIDQVGKRFETHYGAGLRFFNHFQFDWYMINSPSGYMKSFFGGEGSNGSRHKQCGYSITMTRLFSWKAGDAEWFKKP